MVIFHYNRHEDDQYIEETIPAMEFIQRLIRHIPEKLFKIIRYGDLYANTEKSIQNFIELFTNLNIISIEVLINGKQPSCFPSVMILLNILITDIHCYFWSFITITVSYTLEELSTREQCPNLSESALLYNICL